MKVPFLVLSYDRFELTKKLFSYELRGVHTFPLFTNAECAMKFIDNMNMVLKELNDSRTLQTQVCNDQKKACEMFETITVYCPDLQQVIVDPPPAVRDSEVLGVVEDIRAIDDFVEELQILANKTSASNT